MRVRSAPYSGEAPDHEGAGLVGEAVIAFTLEQSVRFYMGIQRPDLRPPEVKAAAERIKIGYYAFGAGGVFICDECGQASGLDIKHLDSCETGRILNNWVKVP